MANFHEEWYTLSLQLGPVHGHFQVWRGLWSVLWSLELPFSWWSHRCNILESSSGVETSNQSRGWPSPPSCLQLTVKWPHFKMSWVSSSCVYLSIATAREINFRHRTFKVLQGFRERKIFPFWASKNSCVIATLLPHQEERSCETRSVSSCWLDLCILSAADYSKPRKKKMLQPAGRTEGDSDVPGAPARSCSFPSNYRKYRPTGCLGGKVTRLLDRMIANASRSVPVNPLEDSYFTSRSLSECFLCRSSRVTLWWPESNGWSVMVRVRGLHWRHHNNL